MVFAKHCTKWNN